MIPIVIWPGAMAEPSADVWKRAPADLRALAERAEVFRLHPLGAFPDSEFIGLSGDEPMPRGPLVIAAFGVDPPARSVQFEVTLLSIDGYGVVGEVSDLTPSEVAILAEHFPRLNTRDLTLVTGEAQTHGLVWEDGSLDLGAPSPKDAIGKPFGSVQIEGDGERILRQLVEDSANLLDELELNRRRHGEGLPKANLLWPWGFGFRPNLPNLALRRGNPATVMSESLLLAGLCRLVGYRHHERSGLRQGMMMSASTLKHLRDHHDTIFVDPALGQFANAGREEELAYALEEFSRIVAAPWAEALVKGEHPGVAVLCPSVDQPGLGFIARPGSWASAPFEPRAVEDEKLPIRRCFEVVAQAASAL